MIYIFFTIKIIIIIIIIIIIPFITVMKLIKDNVYNLTILCNIIC